MYFYQQSYGIGSSVFCLTMLDRLTISFKWFSRDTNLMVAAKPLMKTSLVGLYQNLVHIGWIIVVQFSVSAFLRQSNTAQGLFNSIQLLFH